MKIELGKWLMDIAKYIVTALLLSSVFGDMQNPWIVISVILSAAITLTIGLILIRDKNKRGINNDGSNSCINFRQCGSDNRPYLFQQAG